MIFANMINLNTSEIISMRDKMELNAANRISRIAYIPETQEYKNSFGDINPIKNDVSLEFNDEKTMKTNMNLDENPIDTNVDKIIEQLRNENLSSKEIQKILEFALTRFRGDR